MKAVGFLQSIAKDKFSENSPKELHGPVKYLGLDLMKKIEAESDWITYRPEQKEWSTEMKVRIIRQQKLKEEQEAREEMFVKESYS